MTFTFEQPLGKLDKLKGGYFFLEVSADIINQFDKGSSVRLKCEIGDKVSYSCGLNHLGNGNFFIIVASRHMKTLGKKEGASVTFKIYEDPNPLGVEIPEVLLILIAESKQAKLDFNKLSDGKKRSLIYSIKNIIDTDVQIQRIQAFLKAHRKEA